MSWARTLATGKGSIEFRLAIEGWPEEFVTAEQMAFEIPSGDFAGRVRLFGLDNEGIGYKDDVSPPHCDIDGSGFLARIVDTPGSQDVCASLVGAPVADAFLTSTAEISDTTLNVTDSDAFTSGTYLHIGTEVVRVTGKGTGTLTVAREQWDTKAQRHFVTLGSAGASAAYIADRPAGLEGRRAWLYVYGEGDDPRGDGTLAWSGKISSDAKMEDGGTWAFQVDHMITVLDQKYGSDLDEARLRGVFYPWNAPLQILIEEYGSLTPVNPPAKSITLAVIGFWETNDEFVKDLSTLVASEISGFTSVANGMELWAESLGDDQPWYWRLKVGNPGLFINVHSLSPVDQTLIGFTTGKTTKGVQNFVIDMTTHQGKNLVSRPAVGIQSAFRNAFPGLSIKGIHDPSFDENGGTCPRGTFGGAANPPATVALADVRNASSFSQKYLQPDSVWVDADFDVPSHAAINVVIGGSDVGTYAVTDSHSPNRWIRCRWGKNLAKNSTLAGPTHYVGNTDTSVTVTFGIRKQRLNGFIATLLSDSPADANRGATPFLREGDFDPGFQSQILSVAQRYPFSIRDYVGKKARELGEVISADAKLLGMFVGANSVGQLTFREARHISPTEPVDFEFDSYLHDREIVPTWEKAKVAGYVNGVEIHTGYDGAQDKHLGRMIRLIDQVSVSQHRTQNTIKVKPFSVASNVEENYRDLEAMWRPIIGYYGHASAHVGFEVDLRAYGVELGSSFSIYSEHIPDPTTGKRDTVARGVIVSREWQLSQGRGKLGGFVSYVHAAGYAPAFTVTGQSGSGTSWTLTVSKIAPDSGPSMYASGDEITDHITIGDEIRIWEWDDASPTVLSGTVTNVTAATIAVTFDSTWTPGGTWVGSFDVASEATDWEQRYCYLSQDNRLIGFATPAIAWRFGP